MQNDFIISSIRWFKKNITKNEQNNKLVVCKECYTEYSSARKRYEGRMKLYLALGIIFALFAIIVSSDKLYALGIGVLVVALLYLFSLLSYTPKLKIPNR
ncbi:MAG: hypothetical protein QXS17_01640 [Candidatus Micrarchaeaceae archaeon]